MENTIKNEEKMSESAVRGYAAVLVLTLRDLCIAAKVDVGETKIKTPDADDTPGHVLTIAQLLAVAKYI